MACVIKMNLLELAFYLTILTWICVEYPVLLAVFFGTIVIYLVIAELYPGAKAASNRRKIMFASWAPPSEGITHVKVEINMEKTLHFLESYPQEERPSIECVVVKAGAELLKEAQDLNGKIVLGKFLKFRQVNLSVMAELSEGKEKVNLLL